MVEDLQIEVSQLRQENENLYMIRDFSIREEAYKKKIEDLNNNRCHAYEE